MTMQTNSLPFQVSGAAPTAQRSPSADRLADSARANIGFGATLTREMAARQQPAPAAQPSKPAQQSKPAAADKPPSREALRENTAKPVSKEGAAKTAKLDATEDSAAAAAAEAAAATATPAADMLAFMASLTQPAGAVADAAAVPTDAALAADTGQLQLSALENALENMRGAAVGTTGDDATSAGGAATGGNGKLALAAGVQQQVPLDPDAAAQAAQALPEGQQDAAQFQTQLRESQQNTLQQDKTALQADDAPAPLAQLQAQAAKLDATAPAAAPGDRIPARVGTQAWDNQMSQRIVYMVGKEQAATLTLNPPDLGPVQIVLNVSNDQATVAFSSQELEVRQALENALPRLREMMSENGIALGNATVDANVPNNGQQQAERRAQGDAGRGNGGGNLAGNGGEVEPAVNEVAPRTRTVSIGDRGMVDLFA